MQSCINNSIHFYTIDKKYKIYKLRITQRFLFLPNDLICRRGTQLTTLLTKVYSTQSVYDARMHS